MNWDSLGPKNCKHEIDEIYLFLLLIYDFLTQKTSKFHQLYTGIFWAQTNPIILILILL